MNKELIYRGKRISSVGFFGLGKSTLALFNYLKKRYTGLSFTLRSDKPCKKIDGASLRCGRAAREDIFEDILFLSPSVRREPFYKAGSTLLSSEVEFFFENKKIPVFTVTGSDGKSTTATLASLILSRKGCFPVSANIGIPAVSLLEDETAHGTVAELSSFQLEYFSPPSERALITNISENHLDWHGSMEEYAFAKENALRFAKKRIFNLDCPYNLELLKKYHAFAVYSRTLAFKAMKQSFSAEHYFSLENGFFSESGEPFFSKKELLLSGEHNISNFLAASALCWNLADVEDIKATARSFSGLSHRAALVGSYGDISFYDSSIDSTPTRTIATLKAMKGATVLILGGRGKALSYSPLFPLPKCVKAIVLTGENRFEIEEAMKLAYPTRNLPKHLIKEDFYEAVTAAISLANKGDAVLLSPASTSFDSFTDYKERGNAFSDIIKKYYAAK